MKKRELAELKRLVRNMKYGSRSTTSEEQEAVDRTFKRQMKDKPTRPNRL